MRFGSYEIIAKLGEGGMGVVYRARDGRGRDVALKVVRDDLSADPDIVRRFRREMRIACSIVHPNLVVPYEAGAIEGRLFLASEFVRGGSLGGVLRRAGPLPEAQALRVLRDLLAALDAIARAGMIHRDVKPENLLLEPHGAGKLSDLGLARPTSASRTKYTETGALVGTPAYLAPEQIEGLEDLDPRCDLYAAGALLFECLAGHPPFRGENVISILRQHLETPPPDVRVAAPGVRPEVAALLADLLEKERARRPPAPAAALARVDALLAGAPPRTPIPAPAGAPGAAMFVVAGAADPGAKTESGERSAAGAALADRATVVDSATRGGPTAAIGRPGGLSRARLVVRGPSGERTLFVYAGRELRLGREGTERGAVDVCLRVRPAREREAETRSISSRHLRIAVRDGLALATDTRSTGGTTLDGRRLEAERETPLPPRGEIGIAGVLELAVAVVACPAGPAGAPPAEPTVFIERLNNGREHAYALVPSRLALAPGAEGALRPAAPERAALEIVCVAGALRAGRPGAPADWARPLLDGGAIEVGGVAVAVGAIRPEDQK